MQRTEKECLESGCIGGVYSIVPAELMGKQGRESRVVWPMIVTKIPTTNQKPNKGNRLRVPNLRTNSI